MNQPAINHAPAASPGSEYLTRASLLDALRSTDSAHRELAWHEFRARYAPVIAGFAKKCGASPQDVDDIIQDVMTGLISAGDRFVYDPARGRFRGWLKTCTVRAAIRRAGKNLRFRGVPFDELPQAELAVDAEWNDVWEQQLVSRALDALRQESTGSAVFKAFEQYVLLDRDAAVVATELGTPINNVHQAKSRMTKRLREIVQRFRELED